MKLLIKRKHLPSDSIVDYKLGDVLLVSVNWYLIFVLLSVNDNRKLF